jgi:5-methylcytosine-specific restriction endonuclease McrA
MEISIRDEWTCHLCGEMVDETLPRLAKMGASLDHVVPISKGGTDEPENLKLAHFICNVRKGNKVD